MSDAFQTWLDENRDRLLASDAGDMRAAWDAATARCEKVARDLAARVSCKTIKNVANAVADKIAEDRT